VNGGSKALNRNSKYIKVGPIKQKKAKKTNDQRSVIKKMENETETRNRCVAINKHYKSNRP